jgi:hypothetical protein
MKRVTGEIKALSEQYSFKRIDEDHVALTPYRRGADDGFFFWGELTQAHMRNALARGIDWEGFAEAQEQDVVRRVIDGQGPGSWMDGVEADVPRDERSADSMPREGLGGEEREDLRIGSYRRAPVGSFDEDAEREDAQAELIADFHARIEGLKGDGMPSYPPSDWLGGSASEKPASAALDERAFPSPSEIVAGTSAVGTHNGTEQGRHRSPIPSEIAGDSHVERAESQHGPESDKGHGR